MRIESFVDEQLARWRALCGDVVVGWDGVEMAIREDVGGAPQFHDDAVPAWRHVDESVLVFTDPAAADHLPWSPSRDLTPPVVFRAAELES